LTGAPAQAAAKSPARVSGLSSFLGFGAVLGLRQVVLALGLRVLDLHQAGRGARLLEGLGHHQRHGLVVVLDLGPAQQGRGVELALAELAGVSR
jgi:hypothetical protein